MDSERLDQLLDGYLLGQIESAQRGELLSLLREDAAARRRLVERAVFESHLYRLCAAAAPQVQGVPPGAIQRLSWSWRRVAAMAAAALVLVAAGLAFLLGGPPSVDVVEGSVLVDGVISRTVPDGAAFKVEQGASATLQLADGSSASFDPASEALVRKVANGVRQLVQIEAGGGDFSVAPGPRQFRVQTPVGSVTALGTRFGVRLRERRTMAVAVAEGSVEVAAGDSVAVLVAGQSRTFFSTLPSPEQWPTVTGNLLALDERSITLVQGDKQTQLVHALAADAQALIDGHPAPLSELRAGWRTTLKLRPDDPSIAVEAQQTGPTVTGVLESVDVQRGLIVLNVGREGTRRQTFDLPADARILINGEHRLPSDLATGVRASLHLAMDVRTVLEVRIGSLDREQRK